MLAPDLYVSLVIVTPDGRLLLQRSTMSRSIPDYSRKWKCTLLHRVGTSHVHPTDILNNFCWSTLGFDFRKNRVGTFMWQHDFDIDNDTRIRMFSLKLAGNVAINTSGVDVIPMSFESAFNFANKNSMNFMNKSHSVINKMGLLYGGTGV